MEGVLWGSAEIHSVGVGLAHLPGVGLGHTGVSLSSETGSFPALSQGEKATSAEPVLVQEAPRAGSIPARSRGFAKCWSPFKPSFADTQEASEGKKAGGVSSLQELLFPRARRVTLALTFSEFTAPRRPPRLWAALDGCEGGEPGGE